MRGFQRHDAHLSPMRSFHSGGRILEDEAVDGICLEPAGRCQIAFRIWLAEADIVGSYQNGRLWKSALCQPLPCDRLGR